MTDWIYEEEKETCHQNLTDEKIIQRVTEDAESSDEEDTRG